MKTPPPLRLVAQEDVQPFFFVVWSRLERQNSTLDWFDCTVTNDFDCAW